METQKFLKILGYTDEYQCLRLIILTKSIRELLTVSPQSEIKGVKKARFSLKKNRKLLKLIALRRLKEVRDVHRQRRHRPKLVSKILKLLGSWVKGLLPKCIKLSKN